MGELVAEQNEQNVKREAAIEQLIQEKETRILEAEEQVYSLEKELESKTAEFMDRNGQWEEVC